MPTITTSLHHQYQPKLDALWACREIGSNAIDGEERHRYLGIGKLSIDYSKRTRTLSIKNEGVTVPTTALLMGTSESRANENCIGQFGEGLPMALLVLARSSIPVTILNGDEKWEPAIEKVPEYGNEPVLVVHTRKMLKDRGCFEVQIQGIDPEDYEAFQGQFLRFDSRFDPDQSSSREGGKERVLLQPEYHGSIYNKGVFVMKRADLMFGYDLHGELNRDRQMMDEWDLRRCLERLLNNCVNEDRERFQEIVAKSLYDNDGVLEVQSEYSDLFYNQRLCERVADLFVEKYGENGLPVANEEERKVAESLGFRGVICSPLVGKMVRERTSTLANILEVRKKSISQRWAPEKLSDPERCVLETTKLLLQAAFPAAQGMKFEVVDFGSPEVTHLHDSAAKTVQLAKSHLLDFQTTLVNATKGVVAVDGKWGEEEKILADVIYQLTRNKGTASLAISLLAWS